MRKADREAMARAIAEVRAESDASRRQIDEKLRSEPWQSVGEFAAYSRQDTSLQLRPWQPTPSQVHDLKGTLADGDDGVMGRFAAALLLERMLRAGLSKYEPDPIRALEKRAEHEDSGA